VDEWLVFDVLDANELVMLTLHELLLLLSKVLLRPQRLVILHGDIVLLVGVMVQRATDFLGVGALVLLNGKVG